MNVKRQDLPPVGGYKPINYKRIPAKSVMRTWSILGGYLAMTAFGGIMFYFTNKSVQRDEIESKSTKFAIHPMLLAERDREYLKQLRRNRDEEAELMKDVEGWKVGTWYGEPIYRGKYHSSLLEPHIQEYYAHANAKEYERRGHLSLKS